MDEHLFGGSALTAVAGDGTVRMPPFVRRAWLRRGDIGPVLVGTHDAEPCLLLFDADHARWRARDLERRRLRDEEAGLDGAAHHARAARAFGLTEEAAGDGNGMFRLPALLRRRGGIGAAALWVGLGAAVAIWDPARAGQSGDEVLRDIAAWRADEGFTTEDGEWD